MKLRSARISHVASQIVKGLLAEGAIECERPHEAQRDVESVLGEYVRAEQDVSERAKDLQASRNLAVTELPRLRKLIADQQQLRLGADAIDYLLDQLVEMLMYSQNVDEVFAADYDLRRLMRAPLRAELAVEEQLDQQVRGRLKHVQEGTSLWEVEYRRMMDDMKRRRGP